MLNATFKTYRLLTLDELDACWGAVRAFYPYVCEGMTDPTELGYLPQNQWAQQAN